jgi:hypothetical protein
VDVNGPLVRTRAAAVVEALRAPRTPAAPEVAPSTPEVAAEPATTDEPPPPEEQMQ